MEHVFRSTLSDLGVGKVVRVRHISRAEEARREFARKGGCKRIVFAFPTDRKTVVRSRLRVMG